MTCSMTQDLRTSAPDGGQFERFESALGQVRFGIWGDNEPDSRGTILLLSGRTEFIEKYYEVIRELLDRRYAVLTMDWPGQGLSVRPLQNRSKHHALSFDPVVASLNDLLQLDQIRVCPDHSICWLIPWADIWASGSCGIMITRSGRRFFHLLWWTCFMGACLVVLAACL